MGSQTRPIIWVTVHHKNIIRRILQVFISIILMSVILFVSAGMSTIRHIRKRLSIIASSLFYSHPMGIDACFPDIDPICCPDAIGR
jgi:hypothetical protein